MQAGQDIYVPEPELVQRSRRAHGGLAFKGVGQGKRRARLGEGLGGEHEEGGGGAVGGEGLQDGQQVAEGLAAGGAGGHHHVPPLPRQVHRLYEGGPLGIKDTARRRHPPTL